MYGVGHKNDPSDYAVYTVSTCVYLYKQYSILIVVSSYTVRNKTDNGVEILHKNITI